MSNKMKGVVAGAIAITVGFTGVCVIRKAIKKHKEKTNNKSKKNKKK